MISTKNLVFLNFKNKIRSVIVKNEIKLLLKDDKNEVLNSLKENYDIFKKSIFIFINIDCPFILSEYQRKFIYAKKRECR